MNKCDTIYCYETKEKFGSITEAANAKNITRDQLKRAINNPNRTAGSYHWCTDLAVFDNISLYKGRGSRNKTVVYCYETKERFDSVSDAIKKYNIKYHKMINNVLDNPNRTAGSYHWCTDLAIFDEAFLSSGNSTKSKTIYCYETKEKFDSIASAAKFYDIAIAGLIVCIDNPNKSAGNYHWCTDLSVFDDIKDELTIGQELYKVPVYNYETKEKFDSIVEAHIRYNVGNISQVLNNPNKSAAGYHWCTSLNKFDNVKLSSGRDLYKVPVYCYETKERFDSLDEAAKFCNQQNGNNIKNVLNIPNRTAGSYHWCTDLAIFDEIKDELTSGNLNGISSQEKEIAELIKSIYNKEVITNSRNIISPYELDIYIPDLKLAFEFNGDYWHSEQAGKHKNYHINKTNLCKAKDIQLIHIFEYQWISKTNVIKSMIMNKINKNPIRLYARNCEIRQVSNLETKNFLNDNHIQGFVNSIINLGLYCNNVLVSLMTFGKSRFDKSIEYELIRYACLRSTNVIGGASKLLKYFEKMYKPKSLVSYADISYSNGNLYDKLGFDYISTSKPDYVNIKDNIIYPRYQTMKHKLPKLLGEENFDINLTEQQNLDNNGYFRVWRCGNLKYLKEYNYNEFI